MKELFEIISQPWPWYVAGFIIALVMFTLLYLGNTFGISSNLRTVCSIFGAGKNCEFFDFNWRAQTWNLIFAGGMMIGGFIAAQWLTPDSSVQISDETIAELQSLGIENPGENIVPEQLFSWESLLTLKGFVMLIVGGFLVGFGTRYAGGCTSGHAISGLSDLQLPSLIAVIGFFIGGLFITYLVLPLLLTL
ncbi:YeeE/YedE family protein [Fulvivirga lutea]|uniref:YeeE/YedE family protein n=1 Tax=Fulvivirga lutea TaxID=2810512 RepID=A0A974WM32_9BACT|nr:YeeE/YedE thiosulfate transporter family protein [Fulvivirga lutea]QSE98750.1 YeeE/YedE family protein [Fulvivirga lutea]